MLLFSVEQIFLFNTRALIVMYFVVTVDQLRSPEAMVVYQRNSTGAQLESDLCDSPADRTAFRNKFRSSFTTGLSAMRYSHGVAIGICLLVVHAPPI